MSHQQDVRRWARTVQLPDPIGWGELEEQILAFPVTADDIADEANAPRAPGRLAAALAYTLLWGPLLLAPLVGLVVVIVGLGARAQADRDGMLNGAQFFFVVGLVLMLVQGVLWASTRARSAMLIGTTIPVVVFSLAAYVLVRPLAGASWTALAALGTAILGLVVLALLLFASKPTALAREKWNTVTPEQRVQKGNRAMVLEELKKRGIITDKSVDIPGFVEMPIGTWHLMDERSRR